MMYKYLAAGFLAFLIAGGSINSGDPGGRPINTGISLCNAHKGGSGSGDPDGHPGATKFIAVIDGGIGSGDPGPIEPRTELKNTYAGKGGGGGSGPPEGPAKQV